MTVDFQIYDALEALGVRIEYADLSHLERDGEYDHDLRLIRLQEDMAHRLHRSVLAHECAHAVFADVPSKFGPVNAKQERRAEEWAALRLINLEAYRRAELLHTGHNEAIAVELNVSVDLVDAYRGLIARIGETTYINPRMGTGQFAHRTPVA